MSSDRRARISPTVNTRVPGPGESSQGKSDPKARPKGVVDGHQVNIPELGMYRLTEGVTEKGSTSRDWLFWCKVVGGLGRQIRWAI